MSKLSQLIVNLDHELAVEARKLELSHNLLKEYCDLSSEFIEISAKLLGLKELSDEIKSRKVNDKNSKN